MKNPFKRIFLFEGMVQFDTCLDNELTICGDSVKWLGLVEIEGFFYTKAFNKAINILEEKYPEYKGYIQFL